MSDEYRSPKLAFPSLKSINAVRNAAELDTVEKLADYIKGCRAVVHLLGTRPGSIANPKARDAMLKNEELLGEKEFLADLPELKDELGDCSDLTYTHWEAFLALHYGVPLFIYATDEALPSTLTQPSMDFAKRDRFNTYLPPCSLLRCSPGGCGRMNG